MRHEGIAVLLFTVATLLFLNSASVARAQQSIPGADTAFSISLSPAQPAPGDKVTLTLSSPLYDVDQADITWRADGKTVLQGVGEKTVTVTAGALGEQTVVTVEIATDSVDTSVRTFVTSSALDILWESDSYVPPFYDGRALPSARSHARLQAIPYLPKSGGGFYSASELTYTWKENGATIVNLSGKGKSSATLPSPDLFGDYVVSVLATSPDRSVSGTSQVRIASVEPALVLYRDHPLFGMEYFDALSATTFINENEMTFAVVPYFVNTRSLTAARLTYAWQINGKVVPSDETRPDELTINAGSTGGIAQISLSLTDTQNLFLDARGGWAVTFAKGGGAGAGTGAPADIFHGNQ